MSSPRTQLRMRPAAACSKRSPMGYPTRYLAGEMDGIDGLAENGIVGRGGEPQLCEPN